MSKVKPSAGRGKASAVDGRQFAVDVARIAADNHCADVKVLDLRGVSTLADFFVIGTGTSSRQMHAVQEMIRMHGKSTGRMAFNIADTSDASWILADYVDVVVHLFDVNHREYYDLDGLWGDAPQIDWQPDGEPR